MQQFICETCGLQYAPREAPPERCFVCDDERQFVPLSGQRWTTPAQLAAGRSNAFRQLAPGLTSITTVPQFGIGQRALLVQTAAGNVLWDCISLLDEATTAIIRALGGLKAIAISHPHFYSTIATWGRTFDCPVLVHEADRAWVAEPGPHLEHWSGDTRELLPGLTLHRLGGHYPGSSLLHWADQRALLPGDTMLVTPDRRHVAFMWSYPNYVPLPAAEVERIGARLAALDFDAIYSPFADRGEIRHDAKAAVARSVTRHINGPEHRQPDAPAIPFDTAKLDRLLDEAGIDVLLATSKHNVQYLLGAERAIFFDYMDALGVSRYLPVVIYPKGAPDKAGYIGHRLETHQRAVGPLWTPQVQTNSNGSRDAIAKAVDHVRRSGVPAKRIGVELAFMPMDAGAALAAAFPDSEIRDALPPLERLRAIKTPAELAKLRTASERVIESMLAVIAAHGPGSTKQEIADALRLAEVNRGLTFEYCLIAAGTSLNRAPSSQRWENGDVLSVDSGGNYHGYIGDLARMAILGEPDAELEDMLGEIETIQRAAFKTVRPGALGGDIYVAAEALLHASKQRDHMHFLAHGMGLVSHEAPRLTAKGPIPYDDPDARRPLQPGMVVSIETTLQHPRRGFIKLEDTVAVTDTGHEIFGEGGRGWNRGGTARA